jgi:hypothetical protein
MPAHSTDPRSEALRGRLLEAMRDHSRRQLAHIAVLDIAMAVRQALEERGVSEPAIARVTEDISAFLTGASDALPADVARDVPVSDVFAQILEATSREPTFARVFGPPKIPEDPPQ